MRLLIDTGITLVAYAPELLLLVAIDVFLVMSLLACLFETYFPVPLPYLLQLVSLAGFGQVYVSKAFISIFTENLRFWYSLLYLLSSFACVLAMNTYLILIRRKLAGGIMFLGGVTVPVAYSAAFILSVFVNKMPIPLFMMPPMPVSSLYGGVVLCLGILGCGIVLSLQPAVLTKIRIPPSIKTTRIAVSSMESSPQSVQVSRERMETAVSSDIPSFDRGASSPPVKKKKKRKKKRKKRKKLPLSYLLNQAQVLDQDTPMSHMSKGLTEDEEARD